MYEYDFELLRKLYSIHSPSGGEKKMRKFLKRVCVEFGCEVIQDKTGNLLVTKGKADTYPCVASHIDQVQHLHSKDFEVMRKGDIIFAFSAKSMSQQGLGADDKNGIWIALHLLRECKVMKCAFFVGEEIGCVGSSAVDMEFFNDVRFVIEADRRNGGDLITDISGSLCSQEFLDDIHYEDFGYVETHGLMTDVEALSEQGVGVSCINFSCGYYNPHTDQEVTRWSELCNALDFARFIVRNCTKVYTHKYVSPRMMWGGWGGSCKYYDWYDDYDTDDEETMRYILQGEPYLTFEEVKKDYGVWFTTEDDTKLKRMYEETMQEVLFEYDEQFNKKEAV